jgi:alanyl aminopeptidase
MVEIDNKESVSKALDNKAIDIPAGQLSNDVEPTSYSVAIKLDPENPRFSGVTSIKLKVNRSVNHFYLHGQDLNVTGSTLVDSKGVKRVVRVTSTEVEGVLKVTTEEQLQLANYQLIIDYDAPFNENLQGLHRVKDGDQYYAFTQMESIYARYAFPSFDEPRFKTHYDISLTIPERLKAIANTPELKIESLGDGWKRIDFVTSKPMPSYLFAIAVGDFDIVEWKDLPVTSVRKRPLALRGVATKGKGSQLNYALENTQAIVESLEDYFQSEYPYRKLDILAVPDFAAGAMENPGAITYREQLLLLDESSSIGQKRRYKSVHAHELAHQWFGNLVTPVWWNDIWLNEAFATWMAGTALHRQWPEEQWKRQLIRGSKRAMEGDSIPSARKVRNPIKSNGDIITAFDGITYSKGGGVLSMVESFMGEDKFQLGVQKYMEKYQWKNADAIDFFETIASVLEPKRAEQVVNSFRNFVEQAGVPLLNIVQSCKDERTQLDITQERFAPIGTEFKQKTLWSIPACMSYEVDGEIKQQCEVLSQATQRVKLKISGCANWVMPNKNASGYYRFNLDGDGWKSLVNNLHKVDPREANAVLDSMNAAFSSGKMSVQDLVKVIPATLASDSWEVMVSGMGTFNTVIGYAEEADKPVLRAAAGRYYRSTADSLGIVNNTKMDQMNPLDASQLRTRLINFMANTAKDTSYRSLLVERAKAYTGFGSDQQFHEDALIPALRGTAMAVAVQELGKPFVDFLVTKLNQTNDGTLRGRIVSALAATQQSDLAKEMLDFGFGENIRDNEKASFLFGLITEEEVDDVTWPWLQTNFDRLVEGLPTNYHSFLPYLFMAGCDVKYGERLDTFLKPRLAGLSGAQSNFAKAKDSLEQCLAQKQHVQPQIKQLVEEMKE